MTEYELYWKREFSLFYGVVASYSLQRFIYQELGIASSVWGEGKEGWYGIFPEQGMLSQVSMQQQHTIQYEPERVMHKMMVLHQRGEEFVHFCKHLSFSNLTDKELYGLLQQFFDKLVELGNQLFISFTYVESVSKIFEALIQQKLPPNKLTEAVEVYSVPSKKASVHKIAEYFLQEKDQKKRIHYIQQNFPWLNSKDPFTQPVTQEWIMEYVDSFVPEKEKKSKKLGLEDDPLIEMYQELLYIKDKRDEYRREGFYYILPLLQEISRRANISVPDLGYILPAEIRSSNCIPLIEQRKQGYTVELKNDLIIKAGKEAKFRTEENVEIGTSIKGTCGAPGKVKGIIQKIRKKEEISLFKRGNILVATTTDPSHISAMHKATAFITDEGGITCHAAIVARELQKPCLVGTKNAMKVLQDGDFVEVNATTGTITILQKA